MKQIVFGAALSLLAIVQTSPAAAATNFIWAYASAYSDALANQPSAPVGDRTAIDFDFGNVQVYSLSDTPVIKSTSANAQLSYYRSFAQQTNKIVFSSASAGVFSHVGSAGSSVVAGSPYADSSGNAVNFAYNPNLGFPNSYKFSVDTDSVLSVSGRGSLASLPIFVASPITDVIRATLITGAAAPTTFTIRTGYEYLLYFTPFTTGEQPDRDHPFVSSNYSIKFNIKPLVGGVPEPSSWALLIAGFGLTGAMLRRRRALAA